MKVKRYQPTVDVYTLDLAAALASKGHEVLCAGVNEEDRMYFRFVRSKRVERTANRYWAGKLNVNVRVYVDTLNTLRSRAYANKWGL